MASLILEHQKKVIKCVFTHTVLNNLYVSLFNMHCACIVHALCMVTIHVACVDIEVGPDSTQVPIPQM